MPNIEKWDIDGTEYTLGVVPVPSASDEGKIPRVNASGGVEWVSLQSAETNTFGGGST